MADTTFVDGTTVVVAEWLNDVNQSVYDAIGTGTVAPNTPAEVRANINVPTRTGGDASGTWPISVSGNASSATNVSGTVAIANGGTGATTAPAAFTALKQAATDTATGVVELATSTEVQTGTDTTRAITPAGFAASSFGYGQTPAIVTRTNGVTYTNTTGKPITLIFYGTGGGGPGSINININGGGPFTIAQVTAATFYHASFPVAINATYVINEVSISSRTTVQVG